MHKDLQDQKMSYFSNSSWGRKKRGQTQERKRKVPLRSPLQLEAQVNSFVPVFRVNGVAPNVRLLSPQ